MRVKRLFDLAVGWGFVVWGVFGFLPGLILGLIILIATYMEDYEGHDVRRDGVLGAFFTSNELRVVRLLMSSPSGMSAAAIARELGMGRMTAWRVLNRLASRGVVVRSEGENKNITYRLNSDVRDALLLLAKKH